MSVHARWAATDWHARRRTDWALRSGSLSVTLRPRLHPPPTAATYFPPLPLPSSVWPFVHTPVDARDDGAHRYDPHAAAQANESAGLSPSLCLAASLRLWPCRCAHGCVSRKAHIAGIPHLRCAGRGTGGHGAVRCGRVRRTSPTANGLGWAWPDGPAWELPSNPTTGSNWPNPHRVAKGKTNKDGKQWDERKKRGQREWVFDFETLDQYDTTYTCVRTARKRGKERERERERINTSRIASDSAAGDSSCSRM